MQTGQILLQFKAKDEQKVILRTPKWEDLDDLLEFINTLIDENVDIFLTKKVTRYQEAEWLARQLAEIEKGRLFRIVADINGKVIANSQLQLLNGVSSHVGYIDIGIRQRYRNIGIGTQMLKTLIMHAQKIGLKLLILSVFSTNEQARYVYEKVGFCECGRIPQRIFKNDQYIDEIVMVKTLPEII